MSVCNPSWNGGFAPSSSFGNNGRTASKEPDHVLDWFEDNDAHVWIVGGAIRNALLSTEFMNTILQQR